MSDSLEPIREELRAGTVSAQSLVLLFRAAEEAEQERDLQALEEALGLAKQIARSAGSDALEAEAGRLVSLCEQGLRRAEAHLSALEGAAADVEECPGCGRPLDPSAVRCRACGFLLV